MDETGNSARLSDANTLHWGRSGREYLLVKDPPWKSLVPGKRIAWLLNGCLDVIFWVDLGYGQFDDATVSRAKEAALDHLRHGTRP